MRKSAPTNCYVVKSTVEEKEKEDQDYNSLSNKDVFQEPKREWRRFLKTYKIDFKAEVNYSNEIAIFEVDLPSEGKKEDLHDDIMIGKFSWKELKGNGAMQPDFKTKHKSLFDRFTKEERILLDKLIRKQKKTGDDNGPLTKIKPTA